MKMLRKKMIEKNAKLDSIFSLSWFQSRDECHFAECHFTECHFAECHLSECVNQSNA